MKQSLEEVFPKISTHNCLTFIKDIEFYIFEDENKVSQIGEDGILKVNNPNKKNIHFLRIDHCFLGDGDGKKCDCAVFDDNTFCFVEMSIARMKNRKEKQKDAVQQLENTIKLFEEKNISYGNRKIDALICFNYRDTYPSSPASKLNAYLQFLQDYNVKLNIGNQIEF
ncbi:MAG: hypothetical protein ACK4NY_16190 [Spirosomataceae bacterium]